MTTLIIIISLIGFVLLTNALLKISSFIERNFIKNTDNEYHTHPDKYVIFLLLVGILLLVSSFAMPFLLTRISPSEDFNFIDTGTIGDTVGGLMSPFINMAAVIVTGLAFYMQYKANSIQVRLVKKQLEESKLQFDSEQVLVKKREEVQQFESQFFEMLRLHKENVDELEIISLKDGAKISRRKVFEIMSNEISEMLLYTDIVDFDLTVDTFTDCYNVFFWGWNYASELSKEVQDKLSENESNTINFSRHNGYASSLGHYFRHLFMMVKFVAESKAVFEYNDKMKYLKILRAQLSNHEQIMLFYNWLSSGYGGAWEEGKVESNHFFTEYKMIHNLWLGELYQHQFIVDSVNGLIDKYNSNPKSTPLFEFQRDNFKQKMEDIPKLSLAEVKVL